MGKELTIYSEQLAEDIYNIVHMHIPEIKEEFSVDLAWLNDEAESLDKYKHMENAAPGKPLQYRILILRNKIFKVLYNYNGTVLEMPFQEVIFDKSRLIDVSNIEEIKQIIPWAKEAKISKIIKGKPKKIPHRQNPYSATFL